MSQNYSGTRRSSGGKHRNSSDSDRQSRSSKCSRTSTCSGKNTKNTFMVHAIYVRKNESSNGIDLSAKTDRSSTASTSNAVVSRRSSDIPRRDRDVRIPKCSRSKTSRTKSQDFELGSNDVFHSDVGDLVDKRKSTSELMSHSAQLEVAEPGSDYTIHRATCPQFYNTLPPFLVRHRIEEDEYMDKEQRMKQRND